MLRNIGIDIVVLAKSTVLQTEATTLRLALDRRWTSLLAFVANYPSASGTQEHHG